jgi:hypothetical protein
MPLRFPEPHALVADALLNVSQIWHVIQLWEQANSGAIENHPILLALDVVALRPRVTVNENDEVGGLKDLQQLEEIAIFQQFLASPVDFAEFLQNHWKDAYLALFVFHIQPLKSLLSCAIIHVIADIKGKTNENTVASLLDLKDILEFYYDFGGVFLAFADDSCFDGLQENMFTDLSKQIDAEGPGLPNVWTDHFVSGDPLHIEKGIRY